MLKTRKESQKRLLLALSFLFSFAGTSSCIKSALQTQDSMTESEFVQLHANCGGKRVFLFSNVETTIAGRKEKDWGCWYTASSDKVFATPSDSELRALFSNARPVVRNYVNLNTLTKRVADVDSQRSTVMWLGVAVAMVGCGVAAGGTFGIALAGCALLGAAPASYDVMGGDPSIGAGEAWRKLSEMTPAEVTKMECNATKTIAEQARHIDLGGLLRSEGASKVPCPSAKTLLSKYDKIRGLQVGAHEVKNRPISNDGKGKK
ncbi:MAG: hypothetical protein RLZZ488_2768 [Pseudomonadota bacterium]